ncbi:Retroviral aspartyl protease [Nostoc sp. PCC 7524]|uniref:retropepsin-like aspartic protease family protein n=1 Tax=Nostoc sp. (strain ATCC 29411 / PCC 7524) TaxID=28072 RepID=UPI00029EEEEB|nr:Retroviral aspartyl protease [Nostoc sp. PCC 7524]
MKNMVKCRIASINLAGIIAISMLMFLALSHRTTAQSPGDCFMITASGRTIKLDKLCHNSSEIKKFPEPEKKVFRVPIKRRLGRTPVIDVTFNNKKTFEMIVDTGANNTVITMGIANALQIKPTGVMAAQIADGSLIQFPTGTVNLMTAGGAIANNVEVAIAPQAPIGLLGHDFFDNYDIKILEKTVEFHPRSKQ